MASQKSLFSICVLVRLKQPLLPALFVLLLQQWVEHPMPWSKLSHIYLYLYIHIYIHVRKLLKDLPQTHRHMWQADIRDGCLLMGCLLNEWLLNLNKSGHFIKFFRQSSEFFFFFFFFFFKIKNIYIWRCF